MLDQEVQHFRDVFARGLLLPPWYLEIKKLMGKIHLWELDGSLKLAWTHNEQFVQIIEVPVSRVLKLDGSNILKWQSKKWLYQTKIQNQAV